MQGTDCNEKDWKLLRKKIIIWQEACMDKQIKEYQELLSRDTVPSERFWALNKRIQEDKKKTGVLIDMRRSRLLVNILALINEGTITYEDLEEFSDELKEDVKYFLKR